MENPINTVGTDQGNTKVDLRSRAWFFTWNNPPESTVLVELLETSKVRSYVFQLEMGENNTPHFQGICYFDNPVRFGTLKNLIQEAHWEISHDVRAAVKYCTKIDTRVGGPWSKGFKINKEIKIIDPRERDWQRNLLSELICNKPGDRKIIWFCDIKGGSGKTSFAKYMAVKYKALVVGGKAGDIKHAVSKYIKEYGEIEYIFFLFPRSVEGYVSYDAIESLKDGIFFSGKYESGMVVFNSPHIVCFANFLPDTTALSEDRWDIRNL